MEEKSLEKIGLTKNETKVYLTLLKIGTSKVGNILKESKLNSGKIYEVINSLEQKGLVSESTINKVKHFTATSPKRLFDYIEAKKKELSEEVSLVESLLPSLENLSTKKESKLKVLTYVGFEGLKTAVDEALDSMKSGEEICAMSVSHNKNKRFNDFWLNLNNKRIERKIKFRSIFSEKDEFFYEAFKKMPHTSIRVFDLFPTAPVSIYGKDKILINIYEGSGITILIHSEQIAKTFQKIFEEIWKLASDYKYFEGKIGIKSLFKEIHNYMDSKTTIKIYTGKKESYENLISFYNEHHEMRIKKRVKEQLIFPFEDPELAKKRKDRLTDIKFMDLKNDAEWGVVGNWFFLYHFPKSKKIKTFLIKDKVFAQTFEQVFDKLWKQAKP